jgi:asparagine synthetase B (glutamine-hydrolysing)
MDLDAAPAADLLGPRFLAGDPPVNAIGAGGAPAARAAGLVPRLDRPAALAFLRDREYDVKRTLFTGVTMIEPLAHVRRDPGVGWVVDLPPGAPPPRAAADPTACALALHQALSAAVATALAPAKRAAVAIGGGLDSSAVAACAASEWKRLQRPPQGLRFFHLLTPVGTAEVVHARAVARHLGHALVEILAGDGDPYTGVHTLLAANDFPGDSGGPANWAQMGSRMKSEGIDVLLTGDGGDEAIGPLPPTASGSAVGVVGRPSVRARAVLAKSAEAVPIRERPGAVPPARRGARVPPWLLERLRVAGDTTAAPFPRRGLTGAAAERDRALRCARSSATLGWMRAFDRVYGTRITCPFFDPHVQDVVLSFPEGVFQLRGTPKGLLKLTFERELPPVQRERAADVPPWEPMLRTAFERYGAGWADQYVAGGALERDEIVSAPQAAESFAAAARGSVDDLTLACAIVGLGAWASARYF